MQKSEIKNEEKQSVTVIEKQKEIMTDILGEQK